MAYSYPVQELLAVEVATKLGLLSVDDEVFVDLGGISSPNTLSTSPDMVIKSQ